jgi:hypothetical protein
VDEPPGAPGCFIKETVILRIFAGLVIRAGGEVISSDSY